MSKIILSILFLFILSGCGKGSQGNVEKVLRIDPAFKEVLEEKKEVEEKILSLRKGLREEKEKVSLKIKVLQTAFRSRKREINLKIRNLHQGLKTKRRQIIGKIDVLKVELKEKINGLKNLDRIKQGTEMLLQGEDGGKKEMRLKE